MLIALLPALALAAAETTAFDSERELEGAISLGVRSAVASGWTLVDVSEVSDGLAFTLTRDGVTERHVASFDGGHLYRVEPAELPEDPAAPSARLMEALRGGGGFEIESSCGGYSERPYLAGRFAAGADARALVARSLAAADDLEGAWVDGARAVFQLETGGRALDLIVTLTAEGDVAEAELRRYESRDDGSTYRRRGAMARALRRAFVTSVHEEERGIVLGTSRGRFAIDPDGRAFRSRHGDDEHEGCGC